MNRSRLQIAKPDILAFFAAQPRKVFKLREVSAFLSTERSGWRLAQSTTVDVFIKFLMKRGELKRHAFEFPNRPETLYVWGDVPLLEVLQHLKAKSYFSHYTAMRLHGLTEQVPKTVYISHERSEMSATNASELDQAAIDEAFRRPARVSNNAIDFGDQRIVLLNSAFTNLEGVIPHPAGQGSKELVQVTNVERTLIDAAVRPAYSGGVYEVAKAFEQARETVSVNALGAMLRKLEFGYPYHQAIGFYLERAGYRSSSLELMRRFPMKFDFYLTHEMAETRFDKAWRLHVPKGF
jgi:predicted transcriptional regulator of viral defense system